VTIALSIRPSCSAQRYELLAQSDYHWLGLNGYKGVMQLQHQIQTLKAEARQMLAAPLLDVRYAAKFAGNLLNCASKADRANMKTDAEELRCLATKLQSRLQVKAQ
jgi:hypothetical protein